MNSKGLIFGLILLAFLFSFSNCKKVNQLPSCTITYPSNGNEFEQGDTIVISVEANDNDGLIAEVNFYIDDIGIFSSSSFPYGYSWNTLDETRGNHIIKVIAKDNEGGSKTDECTISIIGNATVVTTEASSITHNSATSGGNITDDGGSTVTACGVCWNNFPNPTILDEHTIDGSGTGNFTSSITGLLPAATLYVRAYATNGAGTSYGNEISFTTLFESGTLTDTRDGHAYFTIKIGNQWWMAENLAYLPSISPHWYKSYTEPYYYVYGCVWETVSEAKVTSNYQTYGVLYNWAAAMDGAESSNTNPSDVQGVCPDGWHMPSDDEWKELEIFLGISQAEIDYISKWRGTDEGGYLKEIGTTHWENPNTGATNKSGFSALPGGFNATNYINIGTHSYQWSATELYDIQAIYRTLSYDQTKVYRNSTYKEHGASVRCIKDE